jgi:hypothetical protein
MSAIGKVEFCHALNAEFLLVPKQTSKVIGAFGTDGMPSLQRIYQRMLLFSGEQPVYC